MLLGNVGLGSCIHSTEKCCWVAHLELLREAHGAVKCFFKRFEDAMEMTVKSYVCDSFSEIM